MAPQKGLASGKDMSNNNSRSQRINDVLIIRMKQQAVIGISREADNGVDF